MIKLPEILNIITELKMPEGISLTGQFVKPGNNIWFVGRLKLEDFRQIHSQNVFSLSGTVSSTDVYIQSATMPKSSATGFEPEYVDVHILPFEILLGKSVDKDTKVERIEAAFPELNWFFGHFLKPEHPNSNELKSVATMLPFDFSPVTYDDNKHLAFQRGVSFQTTWAGLNLENINDAIISFDTPIDVNEAVHEIASLRLLLAFLADDFIAYPMTFSFASPDSKYFNDTEFKCADKSIWLNDSRTHHPAKSTHPFRISYHAIKDIFSGVWEKWCVFHDNKSNQPMIELFFEIISNKSVGLNRFLNICQALEVYSTHHRNTECGGRLKEEREAGLTTDKHITLRIRLSDLLTFHNDIFARQDAEITDLSKNIAAIRNYYTHYEPKKQVELEEKFGDIYLLHSQFDGLLYYLLLATVYKAIGIPIDIIKQSLTNGIARFGASPERTFEGPDKDTAPF